MTTWVVNTTAKSQASIDGTQEVRLVNDPGGTPFSLKSTLTAILNWILGRANSWSGVQTFTAIPIHPDGSNAIPSLRGSSESSGLYFRNGGVDLAYARAGSPMFSTSFNSFSQGASGRYAFTNGSPTETQDTAIARSSAGVLKAQAGESGEAYYRTGSFTVSQLTPASTVGAGAIALVTDADATTSGSVVSGGGANIVMVYSDGTNWIIF